MFIATLCTIARTRKQPTCPLTDEQIKKLWYIYNGILCNHKKNEIVPFPATWVDPEILMKSVRLRTTNIIQYHLDVESKKKDTNKFIHKKDSQT